MVLGKLCNEHPNLFSAVQWAVASLWMLVTVEKRMLRKHQPVGKFYCCLTVPWTAFWFDVIVSLVFSRWLLQGSLAWRPSQEVASHLQLLIFGSKERMCCACLLPQSPRMQRDRLCCVSPRTWWPPWPNLKSLLSNWLRTSSQQLLEAAVVGKASLQLCTWHPILSRLLILRPRLAPPLRLLPAQLAAQWLKWLPT